ncbi:MAG: yeaZ [Paucimonas sp.]|jgi:tRNA threonylcarbamoyladenosine biosynthesis protein TsaB|nr:yeaZ [Paucimonas sp.]
MSTLLAIECSADVASVALRIGGDMRTRRSNGVSTHSQTLLPMVQELLAEAGIPVSGCDAIAFGCGPGSFTGVRTACGTAQGLAFGAQLPLVPVITLLAMAQQCRAMQDTNNVVAVLDARMGEVYWAQYRYDGEWKTLVPPTLSLATDVRVDADAVLCGNGLSAYSSTFIGMSNPLFPEVVPDAGDVAALAAVELAAGRTISARDAQPLYLRNKVALTTAERAARESV